MMIRTPAVAGQFYPGQPQTLKELMSELIPAVEAEERVIAIMSPHAGYVYSGGVAGQTFAGTVVPEEVIVLGPNHHGYGHVAAVYSQGAWKTPLGEIEIAEELGQEVLNHCPMAAIDTTAHRVEHSLEVQVPFVQTKAPRAKLLPICISHMPLNMLLHLGDGLATAMASRKTPPLMVASTDMTHYESGQEARRKDFLALERVLDLDPEGLYRTVRENRISMCGVLPVVVMLQAAKRLGATKTKLIAYTNSGDVTGDQSDVVGYAGVKVS